MVEHHLKLYPEYFAPVYMCLKTFEIRKNDRDYKVGDYLVFREWCDVTKRYITNDFFTVEVTYITDYEQKPGYIVMSIRKIT